MMLLNLALSAPGPEMIVSRVLMITGISRKPPLSSRGAKQGGGLKVQNPQILDDLLGKIAKNTTKIFGRLRRPDRSETRGVIKGGFIRNPRDRGLVSSF